MKTAAIKTTLLSLIIFSSTFSANAQNKYNIGVADTASIAAFYLDFNTYELILGQFKNSFCIDCPTNGHLFKLERVGPNDGEPMKKSLFSLAENKEQIFYLSLSLWGQEESVLEAYKAIYGTESPFSFNLSQAKYNSLPKNKTVNTGLNVGLDTDPQNINQKIDSAWALVSTSEIAQEFIKHQPNYHVSFFYFTHSDNVPDTNNTQLDYPFLQRWIVALYATDKSSSIQTVQNPQIQVFPNPTSRFTKVDVKGLNPNETTVLKLFDLNGKLITSQSFQTNEVSTQFDLTNLPNGIYSLHIQNSNSYKTSKIIKI